MCECCQGTKPIKTIPGPRCTHFSSDLSFVIDGLKVKSMCHFTEYIDLNHYEPARNEEMQLFDINYCPMCGRDLRGNSENERNVE